MKKVPVILLCLIMLASTVQANDKLPSELGWWNLGIYANVLDAQKDMNARIKSGKLPVSFEYRPGDGITMLYVRNTGKTNIPCRIDESPMANLGPNLNELVAKGWFPQDVSVWDGKAYILSMADSGQTSIEGALVTSLPEPSTIERDLARWTKDGFVPLGLSAEKGIMHIFVVKDPRNPVKLVKVNRYPNDGISFAKGIDEEIATNGLHPVGHTVLGKEIFILFVK